jgi:effector-binding domain-containing protein
MGASLSWKSKTEGNGSQSIIESIPFEKIRIQLKMNDWGENYSNWEFEELKEFQTKVTWTFEDSEISFLLRPMGFSFTNAIREDYINSLVNLQYFCEHENQQNKKIKPGLIECDSIIYIGKHIVCTYDEMGPEMGKAYSELMRICTDQDLTILDMPFSIIYDAEPGFYEFDAAFKIDQLIKAPRGFVSGVIPGGETVSLSHYGLSENLPASYKIIENWIQENGYLPDGNPYEVYVTEPSAEPDSSKWETQIFYPVKKLSHEAILN